MRARAYLSIGSFLPLVAAGLLGHPGRPDAQQPLLKIGMSLPVTGADADWADTVLKGAQMAIADVNAKGAGGYTFEVVIYDSATVSAGQYDPAQATTNYHKFVNDPTVVAAVGPAMSGEGKAVSPVLSLADMATISPSATNPDITDPKFIPQYRPRGKPVFFRLVATDAYQAPFVANYMFRKLNVKSVYILDDGGSYGVGSAHAFERQAKDLGMNVLGRDELNPKEADYKTNLTKIKGLMPDGIFYAGVMQAEAKLARQAYEILPPVIKFSGFDDPSLPEQAGKDAAEGWYTASASPELVSLSKTADWVSRFKNTYKREPSNYSITAYDAVLVIADAVGRVAKTGQPVTRSNVREAIEATQLDSLQGLISFDENGDIRSKVISIYQFRNSKMTYVDVAPDK
jgi:branched-chain amino acid transport system substrate-binding protein